MNYLYLLLAVLAEVVGTSALKATAAFTRPVPSLVVVVSYGLAFYLLSLVLDSIPVGIAYAIWAGMGIVLVSLVGLIVYRQALDLPALLGMGMIVAGVVIINVFSHSIVH